MRLAALRRDTRGASAAEFALVLPAALLLLFGVIDVGRYAWQLNQYEKAVQLGTRYAVATQVVAGGLDTADYAGTTCNGVTLTSGDTICEEALGTIACDNTACTCDISPCPGTLTPYRNGAFLNIVNRMRIASARILPADVSVEYSGSGIGYVGDPAVTDDNDSDGDPDPLPDISPIVTVRLTSMRYQPITLTLVGVDVPYPEFSYSLTLEDGDGTIAS